MTYLGDATVEEAANIGAGTITANYDGKEKHATQIGKGAFIGSDTVLIAPVKVGAAAVTGAGSVIPKGHDVPAKGVVVGVPARALEEHPVDGRAAPSAERTAPALKKKRLVQKAKKAVKKAKRPKARPSRRPKPGRPRRVLRKARR
jgi:serine acetyltransferase